MSNGTTYRRGSVFGALLLIAIGLLFLYANITPDFSPWALLAKYWPVLIIFWGLSRLADYFMLRGTDQAASVTRISAGDIIGLLFIFIFGMLFTQFTSVLNDPDKRRRIFGTEVGCVFGKQYDFTDEVKLPVTPGATLHLDNLRGDIQASLAPANNLMVTGKKTVCAESEEEARTLSEDFKLAAEGPPDAPRVRWGTEGSRGGFVSADVQAQVPRRVNLTVATERGDIVLRGLEGNLDVKARRGDATVEDIKGDVVLDVRRADVVVSNITGSVRVESSGGEVEIRNVTGGAALLGEWGGPIRLAAIQGPVRFESRRTKFTAAKIEGELSTGGGFNLRGVPGDVFLETKDYEVDLEEVTGEIKIENRNGPVRVRLPRSPRYPISIETRNGDIELEMPAASDFLISASARDGEIQSDFEGPELKVEEQGHNDAVLKGTVGRGGTAIALSTTHGVIRLRRGAR